MLTAQCFSDVFLVQMIKLACIPFMEIATTLSPYGQLIIFHAMNFSQGFLRRVQDNRNMQGHVHEFMSSVAPFVTELQ